MNAVTAEHTEVLAASEKTAVQMTHQAGTDSQAFFEVLTSAARNPQTDIEKMERLWAMHERIAARDAEQAFNAAMSVAQSEMGRISADAENSQTRSRYATYGQLDKHLRPIYTRHGFSLSFDTGDGAPDGHLRVLAYVAHLSGHTRTYHADVPSDGKGARGGDVMTKTHAAGSAMSYGMRYLLKMIFNVAVGEDDDDGNGAEPRGVEAVAAETAESIAADILKRLLGDLANCKTDGQAAQLWASGSKSLHATGQIKAYDQFKAAVVAHRNKLKAGAK